MADNFLEDLGSEELSQGGSGEQATDTPAGDASAQQGDNGSGDSSEGDSADKQTGESSRQPTAPSEDLIKAREQAAYYRGLYEAAVRNGGGQQNPDAPPQLTDEELKAFEERFLADPYGEAQKMVREIFEKELPKRTQRASVSRMLEEVDDYDEVSKKVFAKCQVDPAFEAHVSAKVADHPDPARVLYRIGKSIDSFSASAKDQEAAWAKREKEIRAQAEVEFRKKYALEEAGRTPPSPATAKGSGGTSPASPSGNEQDPLANNPFD